MFPAAHGVVSQGGKGVAPPVGARGGPLIYGVVGWQETAGLTQNSGQRFTVGAVPITACALRYYHATGATETVYLYRQGDGVLLASASVTSNGGWGETSITPVTLAANTDYVVSSYAAGATRTVYRNPSSYAVDPGVTRVGSVFSASTSMPSTASAQVYVHAAVRTQAPASGHRFFRLNIASNNGRSTINVAEMEIRATIGGSDETGAGVALASSVFAGLGQPAAYAFDDNAASYWSTETAVTAATLTYDLGSGNEVTVAEYAIQARDTANDGSPKDWTLEGSNDLDTWDELDTVTGETGWSNGEQRVFTL